MAEQHCATDSEWYCIKARTCGDKADMVAYSTILELLHRIEALEAPKSGSIDLSHLSDAEREKILKLIANPGTFEVLEVAQPAKPNHPAKPDSSLVGRVAAVIENGTACDRASERIAGDTILAVAAWLQEQKSYGHGWAAITLEQEAKQ
mgnify:CR=1 FL=1